MFSGQLLWPVAWCWELSKLCAECPAALSTFPPALHHMTPSCVKRPMKSLAYVMHTGTLAQTLSRNPLAVLTLRPHRLETPPRLPCMINSTGKIEDRRRTKNSPRFCRNYGRNPSLLWQTNNGEKRLKQITPNNNKNNSSNYNKYQGICAKYTKCYNDTFSLGRQCFFYSHMYCHDDSLGYRHTT